MPEVAGPEEGMDLVELMRQGGNEDADALGKEWAALDVRWLGNSRHGLEPDPVHPSRAQMWIRIAGEVGDDPIDHLAAFTYASDVSLLGAALAAHDADPSKIQMASLDHTIWFHRPFRVDEWWLYDQLSPSASGARGLSLGRCTSPTAPSWRPWPRRADPASPVRVAGGVAGIPVDRVSLHWTAESPAVQEWPSGGARGAAVDPLRPRPDGGPTASERRRAPRQVRRAAARARQREREAARRPAWRRRRRCPAGRPAS